MKKIRKILRAVSEIFKDGRTNGRTNGLTDMGDYIGPLSGTPGVQNSYGHKTFCHLKVLYDKFQDLGYTFMTSCCKNHNSYDLELWQVSMLFLRVIILNL